MRAVEPDVMIRQTIKLNRSEVSVDANTYYFSPCIVSLVVQLKSYSKSSILGARCYHWYVLVHLKRMYHISDELTVLYPWPRL